MAKQRYIVAWRVEGTWVIDAESIEAAENQFHLQYGWHIVEHGEVTVEDTEEEK